MKLKTALFCTILLTYSSAQQAVQAQTIAWGATYKSQGGEYDRKIIGQDKSGIYVVAFSVAGILLEHYTPDAQRKYKTIVKMPRSRDVSYEGFWHYGGELLLFYTVFDKKNNALTLYQQRVDKKTGSSNTNPTIVTTFPAQNRRSSRETKLISSPDSTKNLIYFKPEIPNSLFLDNESPSEFGLQVFDKKMNLIWQKNIVASYEEKLFDVTKVEIDDEGNVFLLAKVYHEKRKDRKDGKPNYSYKLLTYQNNSSPVGEINLDAGGDFISDATLKINKDGSLICIGFYSERASYAMKGLIYYRMNPKTNTVLQKSKKEFSKDLIAKVEGARAAKKDKELANFEFDHVISRSDGGAVAAAEQYYVTTNTYYSGQGATRIQNTVTTYHYNDIILVNMQPDGELQWAINITKSQASSTRAYSSYALAVAGNKIHCIYNESVNSRRQPAMLTSVAPNGEAETKPLFVNKDAGLMLSPMLCRQTSANTMIIFSQLGKKFKFGKLTF